MMTIWKRAIAKIQAKLEEQQVFERKEVAQRLKQRTEYGIEMLREMGTNGRNHPVMDGRSKRASLHPSWTSFPEDYDR